MKLFRNLLTITFLALALLTVSACSSQSAEPQTDTSAEEVAAAKSALAIDFAEGDSASAVTSDIILPDEVNDVAVSWKSSNTAVVSNTGVVTRPAYTESDANVTLTATLSKGSASDTKAFELTVLKEAAPVDTSAEDVAALKEALAITFADGDSATSVTKNITLPSGSNGVSVTWASSNASVVSATALLLVLHIQKVMLMLH
ncbi:MAG: hypothetical protein K5829_12270 [Treponema sp.]|nr:hypothetical protein [Treponema sp.]